MITCLNPLCIDFDRQTACIQSTLVWVSWIVLLMLIGIKCHRQWEFLPPFHKRATIDNIGEVIYRLSFRRPGFTGGIVFDKQVRFGGCKLTIMTIIQVDILVLSFSMNTIIPSDQKRSWNTSKSEAKHCSQERPTNAIQSGSQSIAANAVCFHESTI